MNDDWKTLMNIEKGEFDQKEIQSIPIEKIRPNPFQPRKHIEPEAVAELAQSIKTYGLLQPVIVRKTADAYEMVAGHRRLEACKIAGWTQIYALVKDLREKDMLCIALIENLQRENLTFLEEAASYEQALRELDLTQEVLAQRLGKKQSTIANKLRLLKLPEKVKEKLHTQELTERHARALLKLPDEEMQLRVLNEVCNLGLTVKQTEKRVEDLIGPAAQPVRERKKVIIRDIRIFLNTIRQAVSILESGGLGPKIRETENEEFLEITIQIPKQKQGKKIGRTARPAFSPVETLFPRQ